MENQENIKYRNPVEYLKIFFRRKWLIIAPAYLGLIVGIVLCFVLPPVYESNTLILVEEEKTVNPLIKGLAVSTSAAQRMDTVRERLLGWNSLVSLTKKLNLAKDVQTQFQFEKLILGLRRDINVLMRGPNLIRIAYRGKNPEETKLVTKTLTDILVEENLRSQTRETDIAIDFIKEQLQVYKRKIKEAEIADLDGQLKDLLVDSTEQHPLVKELRHKIAVAQKELESGEYKVDASKTPPIGSPAYEALKEELDKLTSDDVSSGDSIAFGSDISGVHDPNTSIYKLMLMDKLDSVLARDKDVNEQIYNMLLQKLETAKITQRFEASKEGTQYTIIDPPRLPLKPSGPNKFGVIFLSLFMGCLAGSGMVFTKELMDHSFLDIDDAKASLELPILGGISRITTQEEIDKERHKAKFYLVTASTSSAVLIIIVMLVAFLKR